MPTTYYWESTTSFQGPRRKKHGEQVDGSHHGLTSSGGSSKESSRPRAAFWLNGCLFSFQHLRNKFCREKKKKPRRVGVCALFQKWIDFRSHLSTLTCFTVVYCVMWDTQPR